MKTSSSPEYVNNELSLEDWQELARIVPDIQPEQEATDLLTRRDIDINYDWLPHVGRWIHDDFPSGKYWDILKKENPGLGGDIDHIPIEARDTLNRNSASYTTQSWATCYERKYRRYSYRSTAVAAPVNPT